MLLIACGSVTTHGSGEDEFSLQSEKWNGNTAYPYVTFLSVGPTFYQLSSDTLRYEQEWNSDKEDDYTASLTYRINLMPSHVEGTYSIIVERISCGLDDLGECQVEAAYMLSLDKVAEIYIPEERFSRLDFAGWKSWNLFQLQDEKVYLLFTIMNNGNFEINRTDTP